jgi:hypothetical protein
MTVSEQRKRSRAMPAPHEAAGRSPATIPGIGSVANVHGVLESLAIIAHRPRPMVRSGTH